MTRELPSAFTDAAQAAEVDPVYLVEIFGDTTLRYCSASRDIVFPDGGDTYTARSLGHGLIRIDITGGGQVALELADADDVLKTNATDWTALPKKRVKVHRVFRDVTSSATYKQTDEMIVDSVEPLIDSFLFNLRTKASLLEQSAPSRRVLAAEFPGITEKFD